jgi:hypothetical protein
LINPTSGTYRGTVHLKHLYGYLQKRNEYRSEEGQIILLSSVAAELHILFVIGFYAILCIFFYTLLKCP